MIFLFFTEAAMAFELIKAAMILSFALTMNEIGLGAEGSRSVLPCLERILPCQYSVHDPKPPAFCCMHLKDMMAYDTKCFCSVFRNAHILHALNTTTLEAENLTANCGLKHDFKFCDDISTSSITLGKNFRDAIWILISLLMVGFM